MDVFRLKKQGLISNLLGNINFSNNSLYYKLLDYNSFFKIIFNEILIFLEISIKNLNIKNKCYHLLEKFSSFKDNNHFLLIFFNNILFDNF